MASTASVAAHERRTAWRLVLPQIIMQQIGRRGDFPTASALAIILMLVVTVVYAGCARWLRLERA